MDAELDAEPCLADLNDDLFRKIASRLAESDLASAVALKRCSSRFKDLATPLVANAVSRMNTKWRDAADKIGIWSHPGRRITGELEGNEVLTSLNLQSNFIRDEGAAAIAEALQGNAVLKTLNLHRNNIGDKGAAAIGEALRGNAVLTSLNLGNNNITADGVVALASALKINGVLTDLNLYDNNIGDWLYDNNRLDEGAKDAATRALASALCVNGALTKLNLDGHELDLPELRGTHPVTSLNLSGKRLGPASAIVIASLIAGNEVLTKLDLKSSQLCGIDYFNGGSYSAAGITALAEALKVNAVVLTDLNLAGNQIRDQGAAAIAEALRGNEVLTNLVLWDNNIGDEGAKALAAALRVNGVLKTLDLRSNKLGEGKGVIREAVSGRVGFELKI